MSYTTFIPYYNQPVEFNEFVVKHEKKLLIAAASKDTNDIINTVLDVVSDCIVVPEKVNLKKWPFFAIDYLFIAMRAKSIGNTIPVEFRCKHDGCNNVFPAEIDILDVEFNRPKEVDTKIFLQGDKQGCIMKYPTYTDLKSIPDNLDPITSKSLLIARSIDKIWEGDDVKTLPEKDLIEFVDNLTRDKFKKLEEWVDNFPSFHINVKQKCPKCGFEHSLEFRDFNRFF